MCVLSTKIEFVCGGVVDESGYPGNTRLAFVYFREIAARVAWVRVFCASGCGKRRVKQIYDNI